MPYQDGGYGGGYGGRFGGGGRGGGRGGRGGGGGRRNFDNDPKDPNSEQFRKLFVGGLSYETTEDSLKTHFGEWGDIADCIVMRDPNTKRSRGFGFITYEKVDQLDEAQNNRPHTIDGREVETKRAMPRDDNSNTSNHQSVTKMFCGGITPDTTEEEMRQVFEEFGAMKSVDVVKDKATGKNRGFAFIEFEDYDSVDKAVLKKKHEVGGKFVEVKKAVSKDQMNGGGRGGSAGGRGGGRSAGGGGYSNGSSYGGGYGGGYGGSDGYGGGYGQQSWGGAGGYGDYSNSWGGSGGFGSGYDSGYGGGKMGGGYGQSQRSGPYGGGGYGGSGGYNRR